MVTDTARGEQVRHAASRKRPLASSQSCSHDELCKGVGVPNAWIVRAGSDRVDRLHLERNVVSIGWAKTGDLSGRDTAADVRNLVNDAYPGLDPTHAEGHVFQLLAFAHRMQPGDAVLTPRRETPAVAIGEITGAYEYRAKFNPEAAHVRSVRWIREEVPRPVVGTDLLGGSALAAISKINVEDAVGRLWNLARHERDVPKTSSSETTAYLTPFDNLQRNLNYARSLAIAGQHLGHLQPRAFEVDDVFRAAWVQGVAALDHWVRQEIHNRMLRLARNEAVERPNGFARFEITLDLVEKVQRGELGLDQALETTLWTTLSRTTYQRPERIKEGFGLVSDTTRFWERVAAVLSGRPGGTAITANGIREQLNAIVERRNKIAHEYDENPADTRGKRPIDAASATATIEWIEQLAAGVVEVLDGPTN